MSEPEIVELSEMPTAVIRGLVPAEELPSFYDRSFPALFRAAQAQGVSPVSAAFGLYRGQPTDTVDLEVGFVTDRTIRPDGDVVPSTLPAARVARRVHAGGFDGLGVSWEGLRTWMAEQGLTPGPVFWEVYLTEAAPDMDPADLRTELNWPIVAGPPGE
jgi:effector-binding domain-containing protein